MTLGGTEPVSKVPGITRRAHRRSAGRCRGGDGRVGLGRGVRQLRPSRERTAEAKTAETGGDSLHEEHIHASHGTRTRRRAERGVPVPAPPPPCHRMREAPGRGCAARCHRVHSGGRRSLPRSRVGLLVTLRVPPGARKTEPTPSAALPAFAPLPPTATCAGSVFHSPGDLEPVPGIQLGRAPPEREHQPGCGGGARSELCADQVSNILSIWRSSPFGASLPLAVPTPNLVPFRLRLRWPCPLRAQ